ncbi:MAG: alpha/beta hydrolase, partial [Chryseobacterium gambrini]|nr:alpha/beta hydrolase [Chryseobacterium gambrini]
MKIITAAVVLSSMLIGQAFAQKNQTNQKKMNTTEQKEHYTFT